MDPRLWRRPNPARRSGLDSAPPASPAGACRRWLRLVGRRLGRGLRRGVILRRRRDDDQHGGKYWRGGRKRRAKATSASPAANRTALAFMDAFLVCDLLVARRDLPAREPAGKIPSGAALANSPIRVAACASESSPCGLIPQQDDFCASPKEPSKRSPTISGAKSGHSRSRCERLTDHATSSAGHEPRVNQRARRQDAVIAIRRLPDGRPPARTRLTAE